MREMLILIQPGAKGGVDRAIHAIEKMGGRVLLGFPPYAVVALLLGERIDELRRRRGIESVDTEEIPADRLQEATAAARMAMEAWNEYLARQLRPPQAEPRDLPWDAPGRLPPDPPPLIQEKLRRREQELREGVDE